MWCKGWMLSMQPIPLQQYRPRQRAIYVPRKSHVTRTLGYHATIVRLHTSSLRRWPNLPRWWEYSIYIPYRGEVSRAKARDLIVYDEPDDSHLPVHFDDGRPLYHIHTRLGADNPVIHGAFRAEREGEWILFTFVKAKQKRPGVLLRIPTAHSPARVGQLHFDVPTSDILDLAYVRNRLAEVFVAAPK